MERAARLIGKNKLRQIITEDDMVRALWPAAVGKAIAAHTLRLRMVRSTLVVEVEDSIWQRQLHKLSSQILMRLQKVSGSDSIRDVEFRIGIERRLPQRAEAARPSLRSTDGAADEADGIKDAVLKRVYQMSRKKATA